MDTPYEKKKQPQFVNAIIETSNKNDKKNKKKNKEEQRAAEEQERHQETIKSQKVQIPPPRVKHSKEDQIGKELDIQLDNVQIIIGGKVLLEDTPLILTYGKKYGLVGRNGIGKTCLMNSLARYEFEGQPTHIQVLLVEQEIQGGDKSALELVLETDVDRTELLEEQEQLEHSKDPKAGERLAQIFEKLDEIDAYKAEDRAKEILVGLGFSEEYMNRKTKHLSGGWRMRVSLARALFVQPDVLLLDEPTNHLDLEAVMWLEDYVQECKHTVVIVSHAREFLNIVCNECIHYFDKQLTAYRGNYDQFEKTRSERMVNQKKQYEKQQEEVAHMQTFIDKFRANAKRATLVQSRIKAMQRMELVDEVIADPEFVFIFPNPEPLRPPMLKIEEGLFGYGDSPILKDLNFFVDMESRMAILGANGAGKSTFLNLLVDKLTLTEGNYYKNARSRVAIFTQHHVDLLNLMLTPLEQLMQLFPGEHQETYRSHLGSFGITGPLQLKAQYLLSGGQKSRISFAIAVWNHPHIIILDEPTNHLDVDAVNALILALNNYSGGLIVVSHDEYFVSSVCDQLWYISNQKLKKFNGEFKDYKNALSTGKLP